MSASKSSSPSRSNIHPAVGRLTRRFSQARTLQSAGHFLRTQIWAWPVLAALLLSGVGWWVRGLVEEAMRERRASELTTILEADVTSLRVWMEDQRANAQLLADDESLLPLASALNKLATAKERPQRLLQSGALEELRARLGPRLRVTGHNGFFVVSPAFVVLAADQDSSVGQRLTGYRRAFFQGVLAGQPAVSRPFRSPLLLPDEKGELKADLPSMFAAAPVRDEQGRALAVLGLRIRPDDQFTRILQVARFGQTGETYAFDRSGLMLSQSRFDEDLKRMGLLEDRPDARSILTLQIRDPQVNMAEGERPTLRRAEQPFTRLAADAVAGHSGIDVDGYRDYRGSPSIGAWIWLDDCDFAVATEVDVAEAFRPLYVLRPAFRGLLLLLVLSAVVIYVFMLLMARQQRALQQAVLAAQQLGQYTLEEKLGSGGMGVVYRARHALLRRPTAVKLLSLDKVSEAAVARFEREVQLTSALTHPNTIAIFDYGRTPEGIFYYAMEYLEGTNLENLVAGQGPLPEARVVHLLRQVCGALAEAHAAGLVHRDVKPANIFLTCRGGLHDFVKVLDFGLVKALGGQDARLTSADAVTGTPLYLSPEAINQPDAVDPRADVYALGAVGYYLLTGTPVFVGASVVDICMKHVQAPPEPPSARLGGPVSPGLERLLLRCLAKDRADRPADAGVLLSEFEACAAAGTWTRADAAAWWQWYRSVQVPADPRTDTANVQGPLERGPRRPAGQVDAVADDLAEQLTLAPDLSKSPPEAAAESARETRLVEMDEKLFRS